MSEKQSNLTDKEMEDLQSITTDTLASVCTLADKHIIDRDSMLKYFADMLTAFAEVASIQNYETNHACNCQHNSNSRDNEPCCRCDSRQINADRIRNMSDYDLGDLLQSVSSGAGNGNPFISLCVDDNEITMDFSDIYEWLQSEAE